MSLAVGIDIGNDNCVVSICNKEGSVDVLQLQFDEAPLPLAREIPLLIHFDKKQRLFGSAAAPCSSRNPKATISQFKRLIGRRFDEPSFQIERRLLPYETSAGPNGEILVTLDYQNQRWDFTAVELLGMFLSHLRKKAEKAAGGEISGCVIGVPSYFTNRQRNDYLLAAEIAELKPLRLFHDGTAAALYYGLSSKLDYGDYTLAVFVDVGHCDTQVTVVKFGGGMMMVLAHTFDRDVGGRDFDDVIYQYLVKRVWVEHGINVSMNVKASFRLRTACEKAKRALNVNAEAPISIECLMDDVDVEEVITRAVFESMSSGLVLRIQSACERALTDAGLLDHQIQSVELVGSASNIPTISEMLKDRFGWNAKRTLDGSESVAKGCALQCAMLCPALDAKTFGVLDIFPFSVAGFTADIRKCPLASDSRFSKGQFLPSTKKIILPPSKLVTVGYADLEELPPDVSRYINRYEIYFLQLTGKSCTLSGSSMRS